MKKLLLAIIMSVVLLGKEKLVSTNADTIVYHEDPVTVEYTEDGIPSEVAAKEGKHDSDETKVMYVTASSVNVRLQQNGDVHHQIPFGTELQIVNHNVDGWSSFHQDGAVYYVSSNHISETKSEKPAMRLWRANCRITFYSCKGLDGHGNKLEPGFTAASNVLPQGTKIYIEGVGYRTIMDTGSKVMNDGRVDVCAPTWSNRETLKYASNFPERMNVYIVE